jgi:two-component system cell cycle response regulator
MAPPERSHREPNDSHMEEDFIKKLNDYLFNNVQNSSLNVSLLAKSMYMSRPTLYRKIKTVTDLTPNELINLVRLKQAARLLESADYRVFEIAQMVGFNSQSSFGKVFMKHFKVTPTEYQLMNKKIRMQNNSSLPVTLFQIGEKNIHTYGQIEHF